MWVDQRGSEVLSRNEALRLVAVAAKHGAIGRLAVSTDGAPFVHPVNFAFDNGRVLVRIGDGFMRRVASGSRVAFEVDGSGPGTGSGHGVAWSVLVRGLATSAGKDIDAATPFVTSPMPSVPRPGSHLLAISTDVVTGRRFPLRPDDPSFAVASHAPTHQGRKASVDVSGERSP